MWKIGMYHIKMYWLFVKASMKTQMEYRGDLIIGTISQMITQILDVIFIYIVFRVSGNNMAGWTIYHVLLTYGLLNVATGISDFICDEVYSLGAKYLKEGTLDMILLRPVHPIISICGNSRSLSMFGYLLTGILAIGFSMIHLGIAITVPSVLFIVFITIMGGFIISGISTIFGVTGFWNYQSNEIMWAIFRMTRFSQYPLPIFSEGIKIILVFVLPYAFVTYFPSLVLLGNGGSVCFIVPLIVIAIWGIAFCVWNGFLRFYKGTGS